MTTAHLLWVWAQNWSPSKGTREDHFKTYVLMTTIWKQHSRKWWINIWFVLKRLGRDLEVQLSVVKNCISQTNPAVLVTKISWLNPEEILQFSLNSHTKRIVFLVFGEQVSKMSSILNFVFLAWGVSVTLQLGERCHNQGSHSNFSSWSLHLCVWVFKCDSHVYLWVTLVIISRMSHFRMCLCEKLKYIYKQTRVQ